MKKPNIIFLIQDQMQQQVVRESSECRMPNLRSLMADGISFTNAHTCNAVCSPSRASLLTGTLPHIHGMIDCTHTVPAYRAQYDETLDTITQAFCDGGYDVFYYGKWHIERTHELGKFGIRRFETELHVPSFPVTVFDRVTVGNPGYAKKIVCGVFREGEDHTEERYIYEKAIEAMEENRREGKPFCGFISTYAPHDPYCVPEEIYRLYDGIDIKLPQSFEDRLDGRPEIYRRMQNALRGLADEDFKKAMRCYYSYCTLVDRQIGRLVDYLKETGQYDNTLIVCLSDHGDLMGAHRMLMKSVLPFEEVYRIPLIMKLPGQEMAGRQFDFYINTWEIGPTVLELAGCRRLIGSWTGDSMVPWIRGEKTDGHYCFAEFFGQRYAFTQRIYWEDNMKYVFNAFAQDELYDLTADPWEMTNLADNSAYKEKKRELCARMWELIKESGDDSLADAEYALLQIAPAGPGKKKMANGYSVYNKSY